MALLASFFFGFAPMLLFAFILYWIDRYEKEPKLLLGGVFLWGAVVAAGAAFIINTLLGLGVYLFTNSPFATDLATASLIAPLVEEGLKGLAVLGVFLVFRKEFDSVLDGITYAGITALGFAATENSYYIYNYGFKEAGWGGLFFLVFIRVILVGWQHPFYTAFTGIGLALARLNRSWVVKIIAPLTGFGLAMFTHSFHNTLASLIYGMSGLAISTMSDWIGLLFMLIVIIFAIYSEQRLLRWQLWQEVSLGMIPRRHYDTAVSAWSQSLARLRALFSGHYQATSRYYHLCGELAHKLDQYTRLGDESGNAAAIQKMRAEMAQLAPHVQV